MSSTKPSCKKKFVADGVFYAELNELLIRELAENVSAGLMSSSTATKTEIIIRATKPTNVLGDRSRRIRELTTLVEQRWGFDEDDVKLFVERLANRGLCPEVQAESLRYKLLGGLACRRACYGVVKAIMEGGAKGCEIIVSGKLRAQRAKAMKFKEGYMVKSGQVGQEYVTRGIRHVMMRQGVLGIKVLIMLDHDPTGKEGPSRQLADVVKIHEPKPAPKVVQPAPRAVPAPDPGYTQPV